MAEQALFALAFSMIGDCDDQGVVCSPALLQPVEQLTHSGILVGDLGCIELAPGVQFVGCQSLCPGNMSVTEPELVCGQQFLSQRPVVGVAARPFDRWFVFQVGFQVVNQGKPGASLCRDPLLDRAQGALGPVVAVVEPSDPAADQVGCVFEEIAAQRAPSGADQQVLPGVGLG